MKLIKKDLKVKRFSINNHFVKAIVPSRHISIEEGIKEVEKVLG